MKKNQLCWTGVAILVSVIAWDNWQVREELEQLRQERAAVQITCKPAIQAPQYDCPAIPPGSAAKAAANPPAIAPAESQVANGQNNATVTIPPGTDLLEAIKIIQREQAKTEPGGAAINPFGR